MNSPAPSAGPSAAAGRVPRRPAQARAGQARARRRRNLAPLLFISPWIIGFLVFTLWPVIYSAYLSFTDYDVINAPNWVGLDNYRQMLDDPKIGLSLWNTAFYTFVGVPLHIGLSLALALLLNQAGRASGFFRTAFFLPKMTPPVAAGILLLLLFNGEQGLVNEVLGWFGFDGPSWTTDPLWVKPGLILLSLWSIGSSTIILLAALQNVPKELYESARVDGAGFFQRTFHVTLPMISGTIFFLVIVKHDRSFPDLHRGLHGLLRVRQHDILQRCGALLCDLPVPAGLRVPAHGLCLCDGLVALRHHHGLHRHPAVGLQAVCLL